MLAYSDTSARSIQCHFEYGRAHLYCTRKVGEMGFHFHTSIEVNYSCKILGLGYLLSVLPLCANMAFIMSHLAMRTALCAASTPSSSRKSTSANWHTSAERRNIDSKASPKI